ncbi:MAG: YggS family pyridoxal phosphate-dependent enzyme [Bacteroidales bacterium]|jgi:hypothetical protein
MNNISRNISLIRQQIPPSVKLVAVSKTKPVSDIMEAYGAGQRLFGENRAGELLMKKDQLPPDIEWHMIGHLQTNKARSIVSCISLIHSADSFRLIKTIDSEAMKAGLVINCLLQFHIASEETKSGFLMKEVAEMLDSPEFWSLKSVRICGVMGMATFTDDKVRVRSEFRYLAGCYKTLKEKYFSKEQAFREISMGMSDDFRIAIEEGSTMIRIGSLIFGERK